MKNNDLVTIAIPVYNETRFLQSLVEKTVQLPLKKEIIIVDDGSDNPITKRILQKIKDNFPQIKIIVNEQNSGKSTSIQSALSIAQGEVFVILDADGELNPSDILNLYKTLRSDGASLVSGARVIKGRRQFSFSHYITRVAKYLFGLSLYLLYGVKMKDILSGYKMFYPKDLKNYKFISKRFGLEADLVTASVKKGGKISETPVDYFPRNYKEGKRIHILDGFEILKCLIKNSNPLLILRSPAITILLCIISWFGTLFAYNFAANASSTSDSLPNNFTAVSIIYSHRLDLTNFVPYFNKRHQKSVVIRNSKGKYFAKTPIINGILAAPFFFVFDKLHNVNHVTADMFLQKDFETYYQSVGKYYASFVTSLSVVVIFITLLIVFRKRALAIVGSLSYGFASMVYSTASQGNWQHGPSLLLITISFAILFSFLKNRKGRGIPFLFISILLALATLIRISNFVFFAAILIVLVFHKPYRRKLFQPAVVFISIVAAWEGFSWVLGIPGGYSGEILRSIQNLSLNSIASAGTSLLISPNVGLLIFCPLVIFGFIGAYKLIKNTLFDRKIRESPIVIFLFVCLLSSVLLFLFNCLWWAWEGGYSFGPRLLIEATPVFVFLGAYASGMFKPRLLPVWTASFAILFIYSVFIHSVGVYADNNDWHERYYTNEDERISMAWKTNPNILSYYVFVRKVYFVQKIITYEKKLVIRKDFYYFDPVRLNFKKLATAQKTLQF